MLPIYNFWKIIFLMIYNKELMKKENFIMEFEIIIVQLMQI